MGKEGEWEQRFKAIIFCDLWNCKIQRVKTLISSGAYNPLIQKAVSAEADACDGSETLLIFDGLNVSSS